MCTKTTLFQPLLYLKSSTTAIHPSLITFATLGTLPRIKPIQMKKRITKKSYHSCFRRWSRKPYAVFASMHKVVKIGVLKVGLTIIAMSAQNVFAQTDTISHGKTIMLNESVVTGQRSNALPGMVRVSASLSETQVKLAPAQSLNDVLRYLPSVDIRQRGPSGVQADLSVRGGNFDQTQVLINGINFSDPQTGHYSLDLPIDLSMVSRVEVLQGLSAPGAIGGAVNVITEGKQSNEALVNISGGQYGYFNASGKLSLSTGNFQSYLSASHQRSDGYTTNTDFNTTNAFAFLQYNNQTIGKTEVQLGYQHKTYGANGFYSFKYPNQLEEIRCFLGSLRWQKQIKNLNLSATAYHREHFDRFELFRSNPASWYKGHNYHRALSSGGEVAAELQSQIGLTTLSVEMRNEHIYSNVLGYPMDTPKPVPFEDNQYYTKHANRNTYKTFLSHSVELGKVAVTGGVSIHNSNDFGTKACLAFDSHLKLGKHALIYAAANQSLRLPTFTDLFYQSDTHEANPNLQPENATLFEAGTKYIKLAHKAGLSVFHRKTGNTIDWVYVEGESKSKSLNYGDVNATGVELHWQWLPSMYNPNSFIQRLGVAYAFTHLDKQSKEHTSSYALDQLKHKLNVDVEHLLFFSKLKAQWQLCLFDRNGSYVNMEGQTESYQPTFLVNCRLQWQEKHFLVFAEAINLFGVTYFDYGGIIQPKQWLSAGVSIKIG